MYSYSLLKVDMYLSALLWSENLYIFASVLFRFIFNLVILLKLLSLLLAVSFQLFFQYPISWLYPCRPGLTWPNWHPVSLVTKPFETSCGDKLNIMLEYLLGWF